MFRRNQIDGLHPLRSIRYRQIFKLIPLSSDMDALENPGSNQSLQLARIREDYEAMKKLVAILPPASMPERGAKKDNGVSPSRRQSLGAADGVPLFETEDPVFFNSALNVQKAKSIIDVYNHDAQLNGLTLTTNPNHCNTQFPRYLALAILYIMSTEEFDSGAVSGVPKSATDHAYLEHDSFGIFRYLYPVIAGITASDLNEEVSNIIRRTNPVLLRSPSFTIEHVSPSQLFLPIAPFKYLLPMWDDLFELWVQVDFFRVSRKESIDDMRSRNISLSSSSSARSDSAVYFDASDPLASPANGGVARPPLEYPPGEATNGGERESLAFIPPFFAEVTAVLILAHYASTSSFEPPKLLSDVFESPHELLFAASVLKDPSVSQSSRRSNTTVTSFDPTKTLLLASYLRVDISVLDNGCDVVTFVDGPLGMLLRHNETIGLIVNSFQGENGQAEASRGVQVGDVLIAVNGWRLDAGTDAHGLVGIIKELQRPIQVTFVHANVQDQPQKIKHCMADAYELPLLSGEELIDVAQAQMKASSFGLHEAAGGMAGIGVLIDDCSPLQHPMTSKSSKYESPVNSSWLPGVAMVSGAIFVTNFRLVFHRAMTSGLSVDRSVKVQNNRRRRESRSPTRSGDGEKRTVSRTSSSSASVGPPSLGRGSSGGVRSEADTIEEEEEEDQRATHGDFVVPVSAILRVESFGEHEYGIVKVNVPTLGIVTKDGRAVKFVLPFQLGNTHELCGLLTRVIQEVAFNVEGGGLGNPNSSGNMKWGGDWGTSKKSGGWGTYHLLHCEKNSDLKGKGDEKFGKYTLKGEYERMGLLRESNGLRCVKSSIDLAPLTPETYPDELMVPSGMTNDELKRVCSYRSKGRIPAVVYIHERTQATISRSSQPLVGLGKNRCQEDERLLARIMNLTGAKNKFYIMDARKKTAATGNKIMGKGTEDTKNYNGAVMLHMDIANIHSVRDSEAGVWDLCRPSSVVGQGNNFWGKLDSTGWLANVHSILAASARCAAIVSQEGVSVLVHCSDGWDRTSQITSVAQMLVNPYYRTFKGFRSIVEKEWLCFGHKFDARCGRGVSKGAPKDEERAPIFLLFCDVVWQIMQQFPGAFEFNEKMLIAVLDQLYAGRCGTFLYNCKSVRERMILGERTLSLWDVLTEFGVEENFENKSWDHGESGELVVSCNCKNIRFFSPWFQRFDASLVPTVRPETWYHREC
ncbi:hypothetical protein TrRE_jg6659 [Triparma retinervis]|uniref:Phosphatidylinositol-3-phosphatase n=1 Tax=Triparma retinervis TaxID=2557542 RepID=A0A9W7F6X5_9STRA|nr:hypothetical protein TrRE_jg6659 [Triparma retinervis]